MSRLTARTVAATILALIALGAAVVLGWLGRAEAFHVAVLFAVGTAAFLTATIRNLFGDTAAWFLLPWPFVAALFGYFGGYVTGVQAVAAGGLIAAGALYFLASGWLLAQVLARVALALVPFVILGVSAIYFVVIPFEHKDLQPALIAGTVFATGWLATSAAAEYQRASAREQDRIDVLLALRSEIFTSLEALDKVDWRQNAVDVQAKIRDGGNGRGAYNPFVSTESPPVVYEALASSIRVLRPSTLEPILRFYAMDSELRALSADFRRPDFQTLAWDRRVALHAALTETRIATLYWALRAMFSINADLGVRDPAGIPRSGRNPGVRLDRGLTS